MVETIIATSIGVFVVHNKKIVDKILFKDSLDFTNSSMVEQTKKQLQTKHPHAKIVQEAVFPQYKEYLQLFQTVAMEYAKKSCKQAVTRQHNVMQAVETIAALERIINMLIKKLREWYALYCPEAEETYTNHETFLRTIVLKNKEQILDDLKKNYSMGADFSQADLAPLRDYAHKIQELYLEKEKLEKYIDEVMEDIAPCLKAVAGPVLAAELLAKAGSLERLACLPSSTIQMLGAETALFRFLKHQGRCPRHGVIIKHPLLASAKNNVHGKIARKIAGAVSIAAKIDYFKGDAYKGYEMREKLDKDVGHITGV